MDSMEEHRKAVGRRIARLRQREGFVMSQTELASAAGISQPSLWAIESGETKEVTVRTLLAICGALGTTLEYVWRGSELPEEDAQNEAELVVIYRRLPPARRFALLHSARTLLSETPPNGGPSLSGIKLGSRPIKHPPELGRSAPPKGAAKKRRA